MLPFLLVFGCPAADPGPPATGSSGATGDTAATPTDSSVPTTDTPTSPPPDPASGIDTGAEALVVYFDFEEDGDRATNRAVAQAGRYDGELQGPIVAQGPGGRFGGGLHLPRDQPSDIGELEYDHPDEVIPVNGPVTVEFWVRPTTTATTIYEDGVLSIHVEPDNVYCRLDYQNVSGSFVDLQVTVPIGLPVDAWAYVSCALDPVLLSTTVLTPDATQSATELWIGNADAFPGSHIGRELFGSVDDFAVWSVVRTTQEACADAGGAWLDHGVRCALP